MEKNEWLEQAERADRLAAQATDDGLVHMLRNAASEYRDAAKITDARAWASAADFDKS